MPQRLRKPLPRRTYRRTVRAGAVATSPATTPAPGERDEPQFRPTRIAGQGGVVQVGVLLPRSTIHPMMVRSFVDGLELALKQFRQAGEPDVSLICEATGAGQRLAKEKADLLLGVRRVGLLTGLVSPETALDLRDTAGANHAVLLAAGVGENLPRGQVRPHTHLFRNTLSHWQSTFALGQWAVGHLGHKVLIATSFYDAGYDSLFAFRHGFELAGGTVLYTAVTHGRLDAERMHLLVDRIVAERPDFVFAAYCGTEAVEFVRAYARTQLHGHVPVAGTGFLTDDQLLSEMGEAALGITTVLPWATELDFAEHRDFVIGFLDRTGRPPDAFATLGFDTGRLIREAVHATGGDLTRSGAVREALAGASFAGPRGRLTFDPLSHVARTPLYVREVRRGSGGLANLAIAAVEPVSEADERLDGLRGGVRSGWLNPYLCI
jgi:branched-chain amino acid transport system substrate-binding protein